MSEEKTNRIERRRFLRAGVTGLLGVGCFAALSTEEIKALVASAEASGKPTLTEANLNAYILSIPQRSRQKEGQAAMNNLLGYLEQHFTLAPNQVTFIKAHPTSELNKAISDAIEHDKELVVHIPTATPAKRMRSNNPGGGGNKNPYDAEIGTINVITVNTGDINCPKS